MEGEGERGKWWRAEEEQREISTGIYSTDITD